MHGLINRSLECFLKDTYGTDVWLDVVKAAGLGFDKFEAMLEYEDAQSYAVLEAASVRLVKSPETLLVDMGTYLVSNPNVKSLRRLLRFGGETFGEFLHSLDDLQDRARLAVPELDLPKLCLLGSSDSGTFNLICKGPHQGFGWVIVGILQAIADDYGALVLLEHQGGGDGYEEISIVLIENSYADGRDFSLAGPAKVGA